MREALKAIGKVAEECVLEDAVLVPEWVAVTASAALTAHAPSGPMRERSNVETINLHNTIDAKLWAEEFNRVLVARDEQPYDPGFLIGWFANAIMAGFDEATRRATAPLEEALVDEVIYKSLRTVAGMDEDVAVAYECRMKGMKEDEQILVTVTKHRVTRAALGGGKVD